MGLAQALGMVQAKQDLDRYCDLTREKYPPVYVGVDPAKSEATSKQKLLLLTKG